MSYREENDQVVLTMSREDWQNLLLTLGYAMGSMELRSDRVRVTQLLDRLNSGNPDYKPYHVKKL